MIGQITLKLSHGELELNSQDGDTVPAVVKDDMVTVNSSTALLSAVF